MSNEFQDLATALLPAVISAGARTMDFFGPDTKTEIKGDGSPVTQADKEAELILLEALSNIAIDIPVVAEEAAASGHIPNVTDRFFLVDPLDGTKEFINGRKEFTVNVGLIENGVPTFGVVYAPALATIYLTLSKTHAIRATLSPDQRDCTLSDIQARATVLKTRSTPDNNRMTIVASRSHGSIELETWLTDVNVAERANIGSSLKFCLIAQGDADIYPRFGPTREWDTAAGHAVISASGGIVTREDSSTPLRYGKTDTKFLNPVFIVWAQHDNPVRAAKVASASKP